MGPEARVRPSNVASICYVATASKDNALKRFWKKEECTLKEPVLRVNEKAVMNNFNSTQLVDELGKFSITQPKKEYCELLRESK